MTEKKDLLLLHQAYVAVVVAVGDDIVDFVASVDVVVVVHKETHPRLWN